MTTKRPGKQTHYPGIKNLNAGKFRVRVTMICPKTGRQMERERIVEARSIEDALAQRMTLQRELAAPREESISSAPSTRLGELARSWLEERINAKRPTAKGGGFRLNPSTRERYVHSVENVLIPTIGEYRVGALSRKDFERWRDKLGEQYAASTVNGHLRIARTILRDIGLGEIATIRGLDEDDTRITDDEPNMLDADELVRFLDVARRIEREHYALLLFLITTGTRISTALAIERADLDPERRIAIARRRLSGKEVIEGVKRSRSARDELPLLDQVWEAIKTEWQTHNQEQRESKLAFPTRKGGHRSRSILNKPIKRILEHAGISKRFTPHGCRRTCVDLMTRAGGERIAMSVAGHLTTEMNRHYSRVSPTEKLNAGHTAFAVLKLAANNSGDRSGVAN